MRQRTRSTVLERGARERHFADRDGGKAGFIGRDRGGAACFGHAVGRHDGNAASGGFGAKTVGEWGAADEDGAQVGRIAPVRIALEDVGQHGGDERGERHAVSAEGLGKAGARKPGDSAIVLPAARVLMMIPRPPTRAGESESCKTSDEVMRRARIIALAPAVRDSRVRMAGLRKARRSRGKDHECGAVGEEVLRWSPRGDLRASCSAEVSLGETRTAGMCASQWARMSTRPFRSGFG